MLTVECYRSWDAALWQTDRERPLGAVAALVGWTAEPALVDGGPPVEIERIVSQVCAALGPVAFRLFFECDLSQSAIIVRAPRKWVLARAWERMTRRWAADIAIVTNAHDAMEMFEQDFSLPRPSTEMRSCSPRRPMPNSIRLSRRWRVGAVGKTYPSDMSHHMTDRMTGGQPDEGRDIAPHRCIRRRHGWIP
jgi:hypothetical protein